MYIVGQDFAGGKYLPHYVEALQNLTKGLYEDQQFDDKFLVNSTKEWAEWINLKGIAINGPMMNEPLQRAETVNYAEKMKLVTSVDAFIMKYPGQWCSDAIDKNQPWMSLIFCSIYDSYATGNPFYPLFNTRNIKEECGGWFNCHKNDPLTQMAMNQEDFVEKFGANTTYTDMQNWIWTDCNLWDGVEQINQYNYSVSMGEDGSYIEDIAKIQTKPSKVFSKILNDRELKVLIMNGQLDFHTNYFGVEKLVDSFDWYGKEQFNAYNGNELKRWYFKNATSGDQKVPGGDMRTFEKLTYLRVHGTGLNIQREKPELMTDLMK
jgi:carboxypeptidase C (cathepsin A)